MRRGYVVASFALFAAVMAGGTVFTVLKRRHEAEEADPMFRARRAAKTLVDPVRIDPLPFVARIDSRFECKPRDTGAAVYCKSADWESIDWTLEREPNPDTIDGIIAGARNSDRVAVIEIAGFKGFVDVMVSYKMPTIDITFVGFRDDANGRLKLTISANGWNTNDKLDSGVAIAIMQSTEVGPHGIPAHLPDGQDFSALHDAADGLKQLANDAPRADEWRAGVAEYGFARQRHGPALTDYFAETAPAATTLALHRIREHGPSAAGYLTSVGVAEGFYQLDAEKGRAAADDLARELALAWSFDRPDAAQWTESELRLALLRSRIAKDSSAIDDLARRLAPIDRAIVLHDPRSSLAYLSQAKRGPDAETLFASWLDPEKLPAGTNYANVSRFAARDFGSAPLVRRHVLAMLARKNAAGTIEATAKDRFVLHGATDETYYYASDAAAGTRADLRACDVYAIALGAVRRDLEFHQWGTLHERDAQIATMRAAIEAIPTRP
jgi:hypothetical protein